MGVCGRPPSWTQWCVLSMSTCRQHVRPRLFSQQLEEFIVWILKRDALQAIFIVFYWSTKTKKNLSLTNWFLQVFSSSFSIRWCKSMLMQNVLSHVHTERSKEIYRITFIWLNLLIRWYFKVCRTLTSATLLRRQPTVCCCMNYVIILLYMQP